MEEPEDDDVSALSLPFADGGEEEGERPEEDLLVLVDDEPEPEEEDEEEERDPQPEQELDDARFGFTSARVVQEVQKATQVMEEFLEEYALEAQPSKGYLSGSNQAVGDSLRKKVRMLGQRFQRPTEAARIL